PGVAPANTAEPRLQRGQVHTGRQGAAGTASRRRSGAAARGSVPSGGYRHGNDAGGVVETVHALYAGRFELQPEAPRYGPGPGELPAAGGLDGRLHGGGKQAWRGFDVLVPAAVETRFGAG